MRLFGTSGIRGTLEKLMRPENAAKIGLTIATFFGEDSIVLVGRDNRVQSQPVALSMISGIISGGVNVIDLGMVPTPALLYTLKDLKVDGAVMVTGSHSIPEITGILIYNRDTSELNKEQEEEFERIYFEERMRRVTWRDVGWIEFYENSLDHYLENLFSLVDVNKVSDYKVVIDPGNGIMSGFLHRILVYAGLHVISLNDILDPTFPVRDPFPRPDNLEELGKLTAASDSAIGVGTDGDGDRAIFSDEKGNILWGDVTGALFAVDAIKNRDDKRVVAPVNTSMMAELVIKNNGGKVVYSAVGPPAIVDTMKRNGIYFGFEESGKYIWSDAIMYGDAALATLKLLEILDREGKTLSELVKDFPKFKLVKVAIRCEEEIKKKVLEKTVEELKNVFSNNYNLITVDGAKFVFPDNSWLLIRPSGTEPIFRVFAEAADEEKARDLIDIGKRTVEKYIKSLS
ncbi:MAG: phosphoglucosamine mutase [Candidatus Njordarchaeia archaeon]